MRTLALIAILMIGPNLCWGQEPPSSLDLELLEDLDDDLLDGLGDLPSLKPESDPAETEPSENPTEAAGEDLGQESDPFLRLGKQMRRAESLISKRDTSEPTQRLQESIVAELAKIIEQMKQQQPQSSGGTPKPKPQAQPKEPGEPKPGGDPQQGDPSSESPARNSTDRIGESPEIAAPPDHLDDLVKKVWGHLPPRVRQQMQNTQEERAIPGFEKLIFEYYKRLAEDPTFRQ